MNCNTPFIHTSVVMALGEAVRNAEEVNLFDLVDWALEVTNGSWEEVDEYIRAFIAEGAELGALNPVDDPEGAIVDWTIQGVQILRDAQEWFCLDPV